MPRKGEGTVLIEKLQKSMGIIAKERDTICDLIEEYTGVITNCEEARDYMDAAIERLSTHL